MDLSPKTLSTVSNIVGIQGYISIGISRQLYFTGYKWWTSAILLITRSDADNSGVQIVVRHLDK